MSTPDHTTPVLEIPPQAPERQPEGRLERAFLIFHRENPHVYATLVRLARQYRAKHGNRGKLGIGMLYEVARWEVVMATEGGSKFKLSNNHRAFYARLIHKNEPDLDGVFNTKRQDVQAILEDV